MILLDGNSLTLADIVAVAQHRETVSVSPTAIPKINAARQVIENILVSDRVVYGVNTGFGKLSDVTIPFDQIRQLQLNLLRSHAVGVGEPLSIGVTRAMMLLRANVLAKGHSGVRLVVIERLCELLNQGVHPVIPAKGSVGASGDLAPLAHLALVLIGEGEAVWQGERLTGKEALRRAAITPLVLAAKEGLALVNGTQAMAAIGSLAIMQAEQLLDLADLSAAMTLETLYGTAKASDPRLHTVRPHAGQRQVAARLIALTTESEIMESHRDCRRVQDAYSLRCVPQVHGAVRDALNHARETLAIEINSATDNPLVFPETGEIISGGNFHGEPLALVMDYLAIAITELGAICERRIERLVNPELSGLTAFLSPTPGLSSGLMIVQVTAVALQGENKVLAHPACIDSLPTSGGKEDHVSMGMTSALKLQTVLENMEFLLSLEFLASAQALDFLAPLKPGRYTRQAYDLLRRHVPFLAEDTVLSGWVNQIKRLLPELAEIAAMTESSD
jgi:histidine ammonia-lyase